MLIGQFFFVVVVVVVELSFAAKPVKAETKSQE